MSILQVNGLKKKYGAHTALDNVSLEMRKGEILSLLGPTGAGKTSTLMCIAGLVQPEAGSIKLDGVDVTAVDPRLRDIAIVFEGFNLLPLLSAYDNIALPLRSPVYRELESTIDERVRRAAGDLKIAHLLDRDIEQLSGGERQRVAIARALVRDPQLYLLDEPLSALDLKLRESLRAELSALQRNKSATILYATHDYHGAAAIADRIALIDHGRIIQVDTLDKLIADPANVAVGRLIGSPSMSLFRATASGTSLAIEGYAPRIALPDAMPVGALQVGWWPEDIRLSIKSRQGFQRAEIHATDFRGIDRTLQLRFGSATFRKVVTDEFSLVEGDPCWFELPAGQAFFFDAQTGARITQEGISDN